MYAVRLRDGGLLVHSPTWLGEGTFEAIEALGIPQVLFVPNHFHHLSLGRFRERYPGARAVAGRGAMARLARKGHPGVDELGAAPAFLPEGARWLDPEGLKNGEVWLSLPGPGSRIWIVCDAFFNVARPVPLPLRLLLRALGTIPGLRISRTFRWAGLRDAATYRTWVLVTLDREKPDLLLFSHGEPLVGQDLVPRLVKLVEQELGS